jgi:5-carboxymethyl-2-hydroxymuconate isomerase|tara:strand:- start:5804 stop:6148 length:345 start_codon:yes stop_codon:yes gene_type:complete
MPHVSIEFSKGLEQTADIQSICNDVFEVLAGQSTFPDASVIKVRASAVDYIRIGRDPQTFAHATLSLMAGRDEPTRKHLNDVILDVLIKALPDVSNLTVQEVKMTSATYAKRTL